MADSRRTQARLKVSTNSITSANSLAQAYLAQLQAGKRGLRDISGLPRPKEDIGRALKTMLYYHRSRGEFGRTDELRDAYLALADFQNLSQGVSRAEASIEPERRRLRQDIEHFLAQARL